MDITSIYAAIAGGVFVSLFLVNSPTSNALDQHNFGVSC